MTDPIAIQPRELDQLPDRDPEETADWQASLDAVAKAAGPHRAAYLMRRPQERAAGNGIALPTLLEAGGNGPPSYPHPRRLPWLWEFPTVSMGLGPLSAIYQARFNRYLTARGIKDVSDSHVWAFLGDGEMDEPESTAALALASREELDNLTFVINCNLQRLDGPVRANFKIVQELEAQFRG